MDNKYHLTCHYPMTKCLLATARIYSQREGGLLPPYPPPRNLHPPCPATPYPPLTPTLLPHNNANNITLGQTRHTALFVYQLKNTNFYVNLYIDTYIRYMARTKGNIVKDISPK